MKIRFTTLGCKLNFAESSALGKELLLRGGEFHGLYIVHGVTKNQTGLSDFHFHFSLSLLIMGFPWGSAGKESACNVEIWVRSLGWEDPLEKG